MGKEEPISINFVFVLQIQAPSIHSVLLLACKEAFEEVIHSKIQ